MSTTGVPGLGLPQRRDDLLFTEFARAHRVDPPRTRARSREPAPRRTRTAPSSVRATSRALVRASALKAIPNTADGDWYFAPGRRRLLGFGYASKRGVEERR